MENVNKRTRFKETTVAIQSSINRRKTGRTNTLLKKHSFHKKNSQSFCFQTVALWRRSPVLLGWHSNPPPAGYSRMYHASLFLPLGYNGCLIRWRDKEEEAVQDEKHLSFSKVLLLISDLSIFVRWKEQYNDFTTRDELLSAQCGKPAIVDGKIRKGWQDASRESCTDCRLAIYWTFV